VTPAVAAVGRTADPASGRAAANAWGVIGRALRAIGCDPVMAEAGTIVALR